MISLILLFFAIIGMTLGGMTINNSFNDLATVAYQINDTPIYLQDKKIIHLSDLHNHQRFYGEKDLESLIIEEDPDFLFLTGDFVDKNTEDLDEYEWLFRLILEIPTYYIHGNHENLYADYEILMEFETRLEECHGVILTGKNLEISPGVYLSGLPDISILDDPKDDDLYLELITAQITQVPKDAYHIVLIHDPYFFHDLVDLGVDLVFSGHTHGGQVNLGFISRFLFWLANPCKKQYYGGMFTYQTGTLINSRGLGQTNFPFRYQVENELVVVTFV